MHLLEVKLQPSRLRWAAQWACIAVVLGLTVAVLPISLALLAGLCVVAVALWYQVKAQAWVYQLDQMDRDVWRWYMRAKKNARPTARQSQHHNQDMIGRGRLNAVRSLGLLVWLNFEVTQPRRHDVYVVIWRDQVSTQTWRRLCVLSRFWVPRRKPVS